MMSMNKVFNVSCNQHIGIVSENNFTAYGDRCVAVYIPSNVSLGKGMDIA